jgi:sucrose-6-phosphate hydrolase SacC (GH32 family)
MSLPRVVTPRTDGYLGFAPAPELEALRGGQTHIAACWVGGNAPDPLAQYTGDALELYAEMSSDDEAAFGLVVRCSPDDEEHTVIGYDPQAAQLFIDRRQASQDEHTTKEVQSGPLILQPGEPLRLRIFLDRSVVEVFANERACLTSRIYPQRADSLGLRTFCPGGRVRLHRVDLWPMQPAQFVAA